MRNLLKIKELRNILLFLIALNVVTIGISAFVKLDTYALSPDGQHIEQAFAVKAGEQLLGYTPSREEAEEAVKDIINEYVGDMVLTEGKTNLDIQYEKLTFRNHLQTQDGRDIAEQVLGDPSCDIIIIGTVLETEVIEKDTVMKETDELMKGETEVKQEGEDGKRSISSDRQAESSKKASTVQVIGVSSRLTVTVHCLLPPTQPSESILMSVPAWRKILLSSGTLRR